MNASNPERTHLDLEKSNIFIASVSAAAPRFSIGQTQAGEYLLSQYQGGLSARSLSLARKLFSHPSIRKRHFAIEDPQTFFMEDPDSRIKRFTEESVKLSAQAVRGALEEAGLSRDDVCGLVVNTCTGYICPGISTYLLEELGLRRNTRVYDLVGSGCGGAIPNLEISSALLNSDPAGVVVSVSVEVCSATFQMDDDLSLLISNTLFGDGAAAAVLWKRPKGLQLLASSSSYVPESREAIRYVHKKGQLHNQLSTNLPHLVKHPVKQVVKNVTDPRSLTVDDIRYWALHTGGVKIINTIRDEIGLREDHLRATRKVLSEYGNMSSPTVLFVLSKMLEEGIGHGEWAIMIAFGAGLSAHSLLLRMA